MPPTEIEGDETALSSALEAASSPRIIRVFEYWISLRGERQFPAWADVRLIDLYDVAPYVAVLDAEETGGSEASFLYRYRFCGTSLVEARSSMRQSDPTGHILTEIDWPFDPSPLFDTCEQVVQSCKPAFLPAGAVDESAYNQHNRAFFPLGLDGRVQQIVVCVDAVGS